MGFVDVDGLLGRKLTNAEQAAVQKNEQRARDIVRGIINSAITNVDRVSPTVIALRPFGFKPLSSLAIPYEDPVLGQRAQATTDVLTGLVGGRFVAQACAKPVINALKKPIVLKVCSIGIFAMFCKDARGLDAAAEANKGIKMQEQIRKMLEAAKGRGPHTTKPK